MTATFVRNTQRGKNCLYFGTPKYKSLPQSVTINSTAVTPYLSIYADDMSASFVTPIAAATVAEAGTGASPTYHVQGNYGVGVRYANGQKYHQDAAATAYAVTTEDLVLEVLFKYATQSAANEGIIGKYAVNTGYHVSFPVIANTTFQLLTRGTGGQVVVAAPNGTLTNGVTYLVHACLDRNESTAAQSCRLYVNGANVASGNISANAAASLNQTTLGMRIGANPEGAVVTNSTLYHAMFWKQANWFAGGADNVTHMDAFAAARYTALTT